MIINVWIMKWIKMGIFFSAFLTQSLSSLLFLPFSVWESCREIWVWQRAFLLYVKRLIKSYRYRIDHTYIDSAWCSAIVFDVSILFYYPSVLNSHNCFGPYSSLSLSFTLSLSQIVMCSKWVVIVSQILLSFAVQRWSWSTCTLGFSSHQVPILLTNTLVDSLLFLSLSLSLHQFLYLFYLSPLPFFPYIKPKIAAYFTPSSFFSSSSSSYLNFLRRWYKKWFFWAIAQLSLHSLVIIGWRVML